MTRLVLFGVMCALSSGAYAAALSCAEPVSDVTEVRIDPARIIRKDSPKTLFGFSVDWFQFQHGHLRGGQVRPEVLRWLQPFSGAAYRYSAGNEMDWSAMVGPMSSRRPVYANYRGHELAEFGPEEYLQFLRSVNGRGIFLMDVAGKRYQGNQQKIIADNLGLLNWMKRKEQEICADGRSCGVDAYELGNEVDWEKGLRWSGPVYAERTHELLTALKREHPEVDFVANGRTAPWGNGGSGYNEPSFDASVAQKIGSLVSGATIHPYYDGIPVAQMKSHISKLAATYRQANPSAKVYVTEHGRWPSANPLGKWEANWYQASGGWGGVSAADFILMLTGMTVVDHATWHAISVSGPWQLFRWNKNADLVYPSAAYWAMRAIREGYLENVVMTTPELIEGRGYGSSYRLRLVGMSDANGRVSLLGVNRSQAAVAVRVMPMAKGMAGRKVQTVSFSSDIAGADNSDAEPYRYQISRGNFSASASGDVLCIPALTAFSVAYQ